MGELQNPFLNTSEYHTPEGSRHWLDKLSLGSRFYFMLKFIYFVFKNRRIANRGLYSRQIWIRSSVEIMKLMEQCGGRLHITGIEHFSNIKEPVVFVSNHMSTLETMVFPGIIATHKEVTFVVKDSLVTHPAFGPVMRATHPIVVSRSDSRGDFKIVMDRGKEMISNGYSVVIFPQSMRKVEFVPKEFNTLGVKLAKSNNVLVVPVAIKTDFWGNGKLIKDLGPINRSKPIHIAFGKPIAIQGNGSEDHQSVIRFIESHLEKWNTEDTRKN